MTGPNRRRALLLAAVVVGVIVVSRCTAAFDRGADPGSVNVFGPWLDADADAFAAVLDDFADRTGIEVTYTGSQDFDLDLRRRVADGIDLPDVAIVPQPSLAAELGSAGLLVEHADTAIEALLAGYPLERDDLEVGGGVYLAPYRANVKSLVWYRPDVFEAHGWSIPATLDDLARLTVQIAADDDGVAPWCFSIEAGTSTGWAATDWVEDLVLRRGGAELYREWAAGDVPFDDPVIEAAVSEFESIVLASGHAAGGTPRVVGASVSEASTPLFEEPAGCAMYRQADFSRAWFPDGVDIGATADVDVFVLPDVDESEPAPLVRGGDGIIRFGETDEVDALVDFLLSADGGAAWIERGGFLSASSVFATEDFHPDDQLIADLLEDGRDQVFDASDRMPSPIRDAFLAGVTALAAGTADVDELVADLDDVRSAARDGD